MRTALHSAPSSRAHACLCGARVAALVGVALLVCAPAWGEEQRPAEAGTQFVSPSLETGSPAFSLQGTDLVDALDTGSSGANEDGKGNFVIAPLPFSNELIGVGLVLGAGYVYSRANATDKARHSVLGGGGMYADSSQVPAETFLMQCEAWKLAVEEAHRIWKPDGQ